ncbi:uncharacterized protein PHALS_13299 [Plasmopara halstedii]|uniref:Uncharacterized protein n=1 Tax=Plasmopara halstedii TaxID=4781 RepID=A0A0P1APM6_PLAHL|nr:uncharacterized protein PHALS_13299 [Plasmopara halstedii]CEG43081.1 hypothetical protein PHALS_13299 [Plasmopara halstedii]|eukprot:XP_024579450.1 hypothetical protein PHALS_13299 [Plasmopara halstedii]
MDDIFDKGHEHDHNEVNKIIEIFGEENPRSKKHENSRPKKDKCRKCTGRRLNPLTSVCESKHATLSSTH